MSAPSEVVTSNAQISNQCIANSSENIERKKPTETDDECWLHHRNSDIAEAEYSKMDEIEMGKWMMFIIKSELDQMWENSCNLYDAGKLNGIIGMKCSTNYKNSRSSDDALGVIIFYCGPSSDESKMLEYGKNLLKFIPYYNNYGHMYYKSDVQTLGGTRITGQTKNWLYKLQIPKTQDGTNSIANLSENIERKKPTETDDEYWLHHRNSDIAEAEYSKMEEIEMGKWMMFIIKSELDQMWENSCNLYDAGKLNGIIGMKCSTNYKNPRSSDDALGVIIFYCGPSSDESKMLEYGKNLLKFIPYYNNYGHMYYKSDVQTLGGTRKTGQTKNWLYKLQIPKTQDGTNSFM